MKLIRQTIWKVTINSKRIKNRIFTSDKNCQLSDQLKVIGVILESEIDEIEYTINIKEIKS